MKKLVCIALTLLFLPLSGGIQILVHTCGGRTTVEMMPSSMEDPCRCDEDSPDVRCCTLEIRSFHLDDMQQAMTTPLPKGESIAVAGFPLLYELPAEPALDRTIALGYSPPRTVSTTILNCTFLV